LNHSELAQALQALAQQQTALLQAHADGMRLQRVLLEQMLEAGKESEPLSSAVPDATTTVQMPDAPDVVASSRPTVHSASTPLVPAPLLTPSDVIEPHPVEAIVTAPVPDPERANPVNDDTASAPVREGPEVAGPAPSVVDASVPENPATAPAAGSVSRGRAARYFQAHPTRPARVVTPRELGVLRSVSDAGDAARLILQFGPHRGATLGQVAQTDPAYLRELALKAQRPTVRVAALKLVAALELVEQQQKRAGKRSSRSWPGVDRPAARKS
jgi:hypothetical protein